MAMQTSIKQLDKYFERWLEVAGGDPDGVTAECNSRRVALWMRAGYEPSSWSDCEQAMFVAYCKQHNIKTESTDAERRRIVWALFLRNPRGRASGYSGQQLELLESNEVIN